jgi:hypothetical protein
MALNDCVIVIVWTYRERGGQRAKETASVGIDLSTGVNSLCCSQSADEQADLISSRRHSTVQRVNLVIRVTQMDETGSAHILFFCSPTGSFIHSFILRFDLQLEAVAIVTRSTQVQS